MKNILSGFLVQQLLLTMIAYVAGFVAFKFVFSPHYFPFLIFLPLLFFIVNSVVFYVVLKSAGVNFRKFSSKFLMVFGIKIMFFLAFIVLFSFFNPENAVTFLITFFSLYLVYTIFLVYKLVVSLKHTEK